VHVLDFIKFFLNFVLLEIDIMSRLLKVFIIVSLIMISNMWVNVNGTYAQDPPLPPPNGGPNNGHGQGGNQPAGAGAPVGSGIVTLIVLGALYSGNKVYSKITESKEPS
jgi:hypothetical protein